MKHETQWQVEQLSGGVLAWTSPRGRTYLTEPEATGAGIAGPTTAHHVLDQLHEWTTEARALRYETPTGREAPPPGDAPRRAERPHTASGPPVTDGEPHTNDDPPF